MKTAPQIGSARVVLALALVATTLGCTAQPGSPAPTQPGSPGTTQPGSPAPTLGALFYVNFVEFPTTGAPLVLYKVLDDTVSTVLTVDAPEANEHPGFTITVSPDGKRAAWVDGDILVVADLATGDRTKVRDGVTTRCSPPAWSPDSTRLLIGLPHTDPKTGLSVVYRFAILTLSNKSLSVVAGVWAACHPLWAADGRHIVYAGGMPGGLRVTRVDDPTYVHQVPNLSTIEWTTGSPRQGEFDYASDLQSVSPDGSQAAVTLNEPGGGGHSRVLFSNAIIDTARGVVVPPPVAGRMLNAFFLPDGGMLIRLAGDKHNELVLVSPAGKEIARYAEPAEMRQIALLTHTPA